MRAFQLLPEFSLDPDYPSALKASISPIAYIGEPSDATQSRLRDRMTFKPEINLGRYHCRAHVDWVFLHIRLRQPTLSGTLARRIKRDVRRSFVVLRRDAHHEMGVRNHEADEFRLKLHDPSMEELRRIAECIEKEWGLASEIEVVGIEVAVDFYPALGVLDEEVDVDRHRLVAILQRHHLAPREHFSGREDDMRFVYRRKNPKPGEKDTHTSFIVPELGRASEKRRSKSAADFKDPEVNKWLWRCADLHFPPMPVDGTRYHGRRGGSVMIRVQNKVRDGSDPDTRGEILVLRERRARVEVTLLDEGVRKVGIRTLDDLADFDFASLRGKFFCFWLPTLPGEPAAPLMKAVYPALMKEGRDAFLWGGCYLLDLLDRARSHCWREVKKRLRREAPEVQLPERERLGKNGRLVTWIAMNRKVRRALERFNAEWRGGDLVVVCERGLEEV